MLCFITVYRHMFSFCIFNCSYAILFHSVYRNPCMFLMYVVVLSLEDDMNSSDISFPFPLRPNSPLFSLFQEGKKKRIKRHHENNTRSTSALPLSPSLPRQSLHRFVRSWWPFLAHFSRISHVEFVISAFPTRVGVSLRCNRARDYYTYKRPQERQRERYTHTHTHTKEKKQGRTRKTKRRCETCSIDFRFRLLSFLAFSFSMHPFPSDRLILCFRRTDHIYRLVCSETFPRKTMTGLDYFWFSSLSLFFLFLFLFLFLFFDGCLNFHRRLYRTCVVFQYR